MEINLMQGDCLEKMKGIPDKSVDLIITSPPYNLGGKFHTGNKRMKAYNTYEDNMPEDEYQKWQIEILNECFRILKEDGSMFYNHKPRIRKGVCIHPLEWVLKSKLILKQEIVWENRSQNFDKVRFYPHSERIYWLTKKSDTKLFNAVNKSDVWKDIKSARRNPLHNATFPIELPNTIIKCFESAEVVLDPFMGIGTTGISCVNNQKKFIGIELNEEYYNIAKERIERAIQDKESSLF